MKTQFIAFVLLAFVASIADAADSVAKLRGNTDLDKQAAPPGMAKVLNTDVKRKRNYPMQPPTIPHKIDNYQTDLNTNKCLSCHNRSRVAESQAPMVSVTHYMDRDGNFLATVSPRRYFCKQCHVSQTDAKTLVDNTFVDMDKLLKNGSGK